MSIIEEKDIYRFQSLEDIDRVMRRCYENGQDFNNDGEYNYDDDFIFECNSSRDVEWLKKLATSVGVTNVAISQSDYDDIMDDDEFGLSFIDTIYVDLKNADFSNCTKSVDISADEVNIFPNGFLILWWG